MRNKILHSITIKSAIA